MGLVGKAQVVDLRLLLAYAAAEACKTFRFVGGGPTSIGKKRQWASRTIKDAKRLRITLEAGAAHFHTSVHTLQRDGKKVGRIVPASIVKRTVDALVEALDEVVKLVELAANQRPDAVKTLGEKGGPTAHSTYVQTVVDLMTDVFISVRGLDNVKRTVDSEGVRGDYPNFIKLTATPVLLSYYPGFKKHSHNLDRQITDTVARYHGRTR